MAVIAEVTLRGITRDEYDALRARTGWLERPPDGGIAHLTWWEGEDCHSLDGWDSEAAFDAFGEQRLGPAMAALGMDKMPEVTFHPAHEIYTPRAGVVAATETPNMAATSNVDLIRGGYAAFATGDIPSVLGLFADDMVWSTLDSVPFGGVYRGPAGAGEFFAKLPQNWAELRVEPERYVDGGDTVVVQGRHRGRSVSGNSIDLPFMHLWTLRDGLATSFTEILDSATAVQALGAGSAGGVDVEAMLRRMFDEIINQGRLEVADELFADDYVDHGPMGDLSGREAFKQLVAQWRDAVPDVHCEVDTVVAQGDLCGWLVRTTGTHTGDGLGFPATGRRFETVSANLGRLRDGRAVEHWAEQGIFPMLTQIGLIPAPAPVASVPSPRASTSDTAARPTVS
jgi:ketosteroid isomerase-like protein/predicted SnoaL-like aldol condensation-catalyzing enzyme